ncbi:hypothetical protein JCM11491_007249, partial [Sporobolomyces phaffii]
ADAPPPPVHSTYAAGWEALTDTTWAVVLLPENTKATKAVITSGGSVIKSQSVSPGVNLVRGEFRVGKQSISLRDGAGKTLISGTGVDITDEPKTWDYNYYSYVVPSNFRPA